MNINERIREIRKDNDLNQTEFGKRLGVSRSVIANIELDLNKKGVPENIIKLIASTFNISENWLKTGEGEKEVITKSKLIDILVKTYNLGNYATLILKSYLDMSDDEKEVLDKYIKNFVNKSKDLNEYDEYDKAKEFAKKQLKSNNSENINNKSY